MGSAYSPFALFRTMAGLKPITPSNHECVRVSLAFILFTMRRLRHHSAPIRSRLSTVDAPRALTTEPVATATAPDMPGDRTDDGGEPGGGRSGAGSSVAGLRPAPGSRVGGTTQYRSRAILRRRCTSSGSPDRALRRWTERGKSDDDSVPELYLVQGGGEEANVVTILGPVGEDLAADDVIRIDESHVGLAEGTKVAGPGFPASR